LKRITVSFISNVTIKAANDMMMKWYYIQMLR